MLIYNKTTKSSVYFIHIPRTGGRFIREIFKSDNNYQMLFHTYNRTYKNQQVPHLIYPDYLDLDKFAMKYDKKINFYTKIDIKNTPHFTIVRNPFDKFKSEIKSNLKNQDDINFLIQYDKNKLIKLLNENIANTTSNWFISQSSFISPQTKIWKYENGIGVEFVKWIKNEFNFDIKNINVEYEMFPYDWTNVNLDPLEEIRPIIEEIYKDDYIKFGYEITK